MYFSIQKPHETQGSDSTFQELNIYIYIYIYVIDIYLFIII